MSAQDQFEAAVDDLQAACTRLDQTVDELISSDTDGQITAEDDDLADLALCSAIVSRVLSLFLYSADEDEAPPKPQAARQAMDELIPPRT